MDDKELDALIGGELLEISKRQYKSAQDKYNAIQALAKKYKMPLDKLLARIIKGWVDDDRQNKLNSLNKNK